MERFYKILARSWGGLHEAAFLLAAFALGSQFLGLIRDRLLAGRFGAGEELDIYYAAFRIPDLLFASVASLAAVTVLVPFFFEKLESDPSKIAVRRFMDGIFTVFLAALVVVAALVYVLVPRLAHWIVPGFSPDAVGEFVFLTRILLLSPFFFGVSNLFGTITQSLRRFTVFAAGPVLYNLGILGGILLFEPSFGIRGVVVGVVIGAFFHMAIQVPIIAREGLLPRPIWRPDLQDVGRVAMTSLPRTIALASSHVTATVLVAFASTIGEGSIAVFTFAMNLQSIPLAIVGVSYSVAAFPTLARLHTRGEYQEFLEEMTVAARHIVFWSIPAAVFFVVLRAQIVRTVLGSGAFDWTATRLVAAALACFAISVVAQSLVLLLVRGYYAMGDTRTPLLMNVTAAILTVVLGILLAASFSETPVFRYFVESLLRVSDIPGTTVLMLPLAFALGSLFNLGSLLWSFGRRFPEFFARIKQTILHVFASSVLMGFVSYNALNALDDFLDLDTFLGVFLQGLLSFVAGIIVHIFLLRILGNREAVEIAQSLRKRFWKERPIAPETEGVA